MSSPEKSRALGILIAYARFNLGILPGKFGPAIRRGKGKKVNYEILRGVKPLPDPMFTALRDAVAKALAEPKYRAAVAQDHVWLWPLLAELGIDQKVRPGQLDEVPVDLNFLRAFDIPLRTQAAEDIDHLQERIGGLWYIIRLSTDSSHEPNSHIYNVSLLNVKPRAFVSRDGNTYERVNSHLLHFSLKSRFSEHLGQAVQAHRGRVIELGGTIYFVGDRRVANLKKMFLMAWAAPIVSDHRGRINHAESAQGVIVTGNSSDVTVAGPMVARQIRGIEGVAKLQRGKNEKEADWHHREADFYKECADKAANHVRAYTRDELALAFKGIDCAPSIETSIAALDRGVADVRKTGYTRVTHI